MVQAAIDGLNNKETAARYNLSLNTVKVYFSRLYTKLKVDDRWALGIWGRAYAEAQRLTAERCRALARELNPEGPELPMQPPTFENVQIARFEVIVSLLQTVELTYAQAHELITLLSGKLITSPPPEPTYCQIPPVRSGNPLTKGDYL